MSPVRGLPGAVYPGEKINQLTEEVGRLRAEIERLTMQAAERDKLLRALDGRDVPAPRLRDRISGVSAVVEVSEVAVEAALKAWIDYDVDPTWTDTRNGMRAAITAALPFLRTAPPEAAPGPSAEAANG